VWLYSGKVLCKCLLFQIVWPLARVLPLYLKINVAYKVCHFLNEELLILLNFSIDIEDVHVLWISIFINIWENYRLLNLFIFEIWEYIFYMGYTICPPNSSHSFWVKSLSFCWILVWIWYGLIKVFTWRRKTLLNNILISESISNIVEKFFINRQIILLFKWNFIRFIWKRVQAMEIQ
jgi:hypothetical protein